MLADLPPVDTIYVAPQREPVINLVELITESYMRRHPEVRDAAKASVAANMPDQAYHFSIPAGDYTLDLMNPYVPGRLYIIKSNISIEGAGMDATSLEVNQASFDTSMERGDTPFLGIMYNLNGEKRLQSVSLKGFSLSLPEGAISNKSRILIRIGYADSVMVDDVRLTLDNGSVTNLMTLNSSNVTITNSVFENDNTAVITSNGYPEGGCVWCTDGLENALIQNCTFRKYGCDEPLAFYSVSAFERWTGWKDYVRKWENIKVDSNTFIYGDKDKTYEGAGVFLSLGISAGNTDISSYLASGKEISKNIMRNISFENNSFTFYAPVQMAFSLCARPYDIWENVSICDNTIYRTADADYHYQWGGVTDIIASCRPWGATENSQRQPILIKGNRFQAEQRMTNFYYGYKLVELEGMDADLQDNALDATGIRLQRRSYDFGVTLLSVLGGESNFTATGNRLYGLNNLALFTNGIAEANQTPVSINVQGNTITGNPTTYFPDTGYAGRVNFKFSGNTCNYRPAQMFVNAPRSLRSQIRW